MSEEVTPPSMPVPAAPEEPPPTDSQGLPLRGADEPGVRDLILAFRDDWQQWKGTNDERMAAITGGMKLLDARQAVIEIDVRQLRIDVETARSTADAARMRADTAHTMAQTASFAAGRASQDGEAERELLLASLASTRGELQAATAAIGSLTRRDDELKATDEEIKTMVAQAAKDSAGAAIREVVGKNPKLVAGIAAVLIVLAQVLSQRFLVPPAAPNQGALPAPTPTVHVDQKDSP